ncbi:MAG: hypothetical protein K8H86_14115, partial [Ignavibacteriaceae bacterium]|nr:hypothetical protein [Ignavibacteriaceae bacterium]
MDILYKKLQLKEKLNYALVNLPDDLSSLFENLPLHSKLSKKLSPGLDFILTFARLKKDIDKSMPSLIKSIAAGGIIWISYPKKDSGIDSDLSRNESWSA